MQAQLTKEKSTINDIFSVYPNPTSSEINIKYILKNYEKGDVIIYDVLGRARIQIQLSNTIQKTIVDVSKLEQGIYTYKFLINNVQSNSGKIIIE